MIDLTIKQERKQYRMIKKACYLFFIYGLCYGCKSRSYTSHPAVTNQPTKSLSPLPVFHYHSQGDSKTHLFKSIQNAQKNIL